MCPYKICSRIHLKTSSPYAHEELIMKNASHKGDISKFRNEFLSSFRILKKEIRFTGEITVTTIPEALIEKRAGGRLQGKGKKKGKCRYGVSVC